MRTFKSIMRASLKTQSALAEELGVTQTLVSAWCVGKCRPSVSKIPQIAKFLGTTTEEIVNSFAENNQVEEIKRG